MREKEYQVMKKIEFVENKKFEERYKKIVKETELNCEEDENF